MLCLLNLVLAGFLVAESAVFNDGSSRYKVFPVALATYAHEPDKCLAALFGNCELVYSAWAECGATESAKCYGFAGVSHEQKAIFLAYRATLKAFQQVYRNMDSVFAPKTKSPVGGCVSSYLASVSRNFRTARLVGAICDLSRQYPDYAVWITGHGIGGALASLTAGELVVFDGIHRNRVLMESYGQPREGDKDYASNYTIAVPYAWRLICGADSMAHLPNTGYYHHSDEVWFLRGMELDSLYLQCSAENKQCSSTPVCAQHNVQDHVKYFDSVIEAMARSSACEGVGSIRDMIMGL